MTKTSSGLNESILILGATGNIGSYLVEQLAEAGHRVRVLVRDRQKAERIAALATPVLADLARPESLAPAFEGAERVFVLAPTSPETESLERNAIDAALAAGAKRIVYVSNILAAEGDPVDHYHAQGKHERRLASLNVESTILRPTRFMTHTPFVWSSVLERGLLLEGGAGRRTVVDTADVAAVALKALTEDGHEGQRYDLTSDDYFTAGELAEILSRALGREVAVFEGGVDALRAALLESGAPADYAPLMAGYSERVAAGRFERTDTLGRLLGRPPRSYAQWLERNLPDIRSRAAREGADIPKHDPSTRRRRMPRARPRSTNRTILVTGPTGKVGRRLIPLLARRGVRVRAANRSPVMARPGIEPVRFDWSDETTYEAAREGVSAMYLVAGPIPQPKHADRIRALLDGAAGDGIGCVVLLSSFGVGEAPPENPLRRIELAVESSGVPCTILRPVAFMQNFSEGLRWRESFAQGIRDRDEIVGPGGSGIVSYVSTEDIAAVAAAALTEDGHGGKAYAPVGPEPLTLTQVAEHISWVTGRRIRYVETDRTPIRDALLAAGAPPETAEHNSQVYTQAFSSSRFGVLTDDIFDVTGRPPTSFAEFAVGAAAAWRR